jgi:AraC family transcriptional regulator of adaptative response / methylphosphotriester-DNA alkyltransferase methyltransferase
MEAPLFERIYASVVLRETTYDGVFYTGVRTTKIVCRPSCRAKTPLARNVMFYRSLDEALAAGLRPCKRCKPEAGGKLNPDAALAAQTDAILETQYQQKLSLSSLAAKLAVSPFHLQRTYKRATGMSPAEKLDQVRLREATKQLGENTLLVAEVGSAVGFRGPSHFAVWFQRKIGLSPTEYREQRQQEAKEGI